MAPSSQRRSSLGVAAIALASLTVATQAAEIVEIATLPAEEATQAAAADPRFVYAASSTTVAKYDRKTGQRLALSRGEASHLNSAFLLNGKIYCAHSNYPRKPEHSEIKVLNPETMRLETFHNFGASDGSLTWAVQDGGNWWCTFAFYGADNRRTRLVKFDENWRELGAWSYPAKVIARLGEYSISGGLWWKGEIWATGHDRREVYRLALPENGKTLELRGTVRSPFPGQGIAVAGGSDGVFVGVDRAAKTVVFGEFR
jgi:hypothetical protein